MRLWLGAAIALVCVNGLMAQEQESPIGTNPVFAGADPHAAVFGNRIWIYPTRGVRNGPGFAALSSRDLRTWRPEGAVLRFADVRWIDDDGEKVHHAWAPCIAKKGNKYYFYYSVGPQGRTPSRIGVAVGSSPKGPFVDSGKPLLTGGNGFEAIDPMVFHDRKRNRWLIYAGGSAGAKLRVFEMADDMVNFRKEIDVETPPHFTEGAFMHVRNGVYFLSYSHGGYQNNTYSVHYATSSTPVGPWKYGGKILAGDAKHKGPGHHSIIRGPGADEWYIVYHRWNNREGEGPYQGGRETAIDVLYHDGKSKIRPVVMTDTVPIASKGKFRED